MTTDPEFIGCGLIISKSVKEVRGASGEILSPPCMYVVWYDPKCNTLHKEPISFGAAQALAPERFRIAVAELNAARKRSGYPR